MSYELIVYLENMKEKKFTIQELKEMKEILEQEKNSMGLRLTKIKEPEKQEKGRSK